MTNTRSKKHVRRTEAGNEMESKVRDICAVTAPLKKAMQHAKRDASKDETQASSSQKLLSGSPERVYEARAIANSNRFKFAFLPSLIPLEEGKCFLFQR